MNFMNPMLWNKKGGPIFLFTFHSFKTAFFLSVFLAFLFVSLYFFGFFFLNFNFSPPFSPQFIMSVFWTVGFFYW
jgi:hypothetical protein